MPQRNNKKLTLTALKKVLNSKNKPELIQEIAELFKKFPDVKDYYQAQEGNTEAVLEKYKNIIKKEFRDGFTHGLPKARLSTARKAVQDFKKVTEYPDLVAEVMFTFVEEISNFNNDFGVDGESYYTSPEAMYHDVLSLLEKHNLLSHFQERARNIIENATHGWGHFDSLSESYYQFYDELKNNKT